MIISSSTLVQRVRPKIKEIEIAALARLNKQSRCLIDVREPDEFANGHITDAVNIPRGVLEMQLSKHPMVAGQNDPLEKLATIDIYLICRSGARTTLAAESLQRMGFENVYSVKGGMMAWNEAGMAMDN